MVNDWKINSITDLLKPNGIKIGPFGSQLKKELFITNGNYKVYGQENIYAKNFSIGNRYMTRSHFDKLSSCEILPGDFVMSTMGTIGKCAIVPNNITRGIMDSHLIRLRFDERKISSSYLLHLFSPDIRYLTAQTDKLSVGGIMDGLSVKIVSSLMVEYPRSIEEQENIVDILSDVDSMIYSLEKLIAKKKAVKQGAMQELLTGKKRLNGFSGEWIEVALDSACSLITKQTGFDYTNEIKASLADFHMTNSIPFIQNKDFEGKHINLETDYYIPMYIALKYPRILLNATCGLVSLSGRIGNVGLYKKENGLAFIGGAVGILRFYDEIVAEWSILFLQSNEGQRQLFENQKSGAQHNLTVEDVRSLKIKMPKEKSEQTAIASILSDMDNEIEALEKKLAKTRQLKQGMMQQLLTGKIRLVTEEKATAAISVIEQTNLPHSKSGHNQQFDDAVMIAAIVNAFYSEKYPLGRKKVQKLLYLLRRKQEEDTSAFKKKAAGPYADVVRYKGGEPIARKQGYIATATTQKGTAFARGKAIDVALSYIDKWQMQSDIDWLVSTFKYTKTNDLELYATIDMAICDLQHEGIAVSVDSVKDLIRSNKEWKAKLTKTYFSDADIARAITMCKRLYSS